jgi:hypothetical protein
MALSKVVSICNARKVVISLPHPHFLHLLIPPLIPRPRWDEGQKFTALFFAHFDTAFDTACDNQIGVRERERISNVIFSHGDTAFDTANHPILGSGKGKCGKGGAEGHWLQ